MGPLPWGHTLIQKRRVHTQYGVWPWPLEVVIGMPAVGASLQGLQSSGDNPDAQSGLETAVLWGGCRASEEVGRPEGFQSQGPWSWCQMAGTRERVGGRKGRATLAF